MSIAYVEHPVTTEEKLSYKKSGFAKVIDIKYAPEVLGENDRKFPKAKAKAKPAKRD